MGDEKETSGGITNYFYGTVNKVINNYGTYNQNAPDNYGTGGKAEPHFPINNSKEEGRQWFEFLVRKGFIAANTELNCWLFLMGFSMDQPTEVKPIAWLKTVETARLMIKRIHGNLIESKQLSEKEMKELASQCFTKQGEPLKLAKPKKELSADADDIENFLPTISDL